MALKQNTTLANGLTVNYAYIRIDTIDGYKGEITISVNIYLSQQHFLDNKPYLEQKIYNFVPSVEDTSSNFIKQGYEYLKSLEEYSDAVDC